MRGPDGAPTDEAERRIAAAVGRANEKLARFEQVRKFVIVADGFQMETGELTPTLKLRRQTVRERYGATLDRLYQEDGFGLIPQ
jgi:long-chain acyl-CoA synthetase